MGDMVWASAVNPNFFNAAGIRYKDLDNTTDKDTLFFGGDTVANCPALYAHFLSTTFNNIPIEKISVVAIGMTDYTSMKITDKVSVLDWVMRLY